MEIHFLLTVWPFEVLEGMSLVCKWWLRPGWGNSSAVASFKATFQSWRKLWIPKMVENEHGFIVLTWENINCFSSNIENRLLNFHSSCWIRQVTFSLCNCWNNRENMLEHFNTNNFSLSDAGEIWMSILCSYARASHHYFHSLIEGNIT